ncbi:MAG TPA: hypothetical protein VEQ16_12235 [Acidocella sp.]|nr:hypothetical protein [Acidocella sp.]
MNMPYLQDLTIRGWGVFRDSPWHLAGVYYTEAQATAKASQLGNEYKIAYGENRDSTSDFISLEQGFHGLSQMAATRAG